jgi:single-strand selective monofunctional uracil DNA glycosylase
MTQTGVPFGAVSVVRDWMGLQEVVRRPAVVHPKRPILGFAHPRDEVSGQRLWGLFRHHFGTPEATFERLVVLNYCPLVFLDEGGRNLTPDKLRAEEQGPLFEACDRALARAIALLEPSRLIGVGAFAEARLSRVAGGAPVGRIPHPSPASPAANRGYARLAGQALRNLGVDLPGELAG